MADNLAMTGTIQFFVTCIIDTLYPQVGEAAVRILRRAGARVEFPAAQTCCGQPAFNAGMRPQARQMAEHTIRVLESAPGMVVLPSGSCAAMIRHGYLEIFAGDARWFSRAESLANRTYELTEFLVDILRVTDVGARFNGLLAYHASCHLSRDLGVKQQPSLLLRNVKEAEIVDLLHGEGCCGFGGLFSIEYPEISRAMLDRKIHNIRSSAANVVVACDAGCISHINGGLHRRGLSPCVRHIAEVLEKT